ncbi:MAG: peptidoglycan-binding protein [Minisyncoccia bacterium]
MNTKIFKFLFVLTIVFSAYSASALSYVPPSGAACNFTRDLMPGTWGEDVRCLQQYLKTSGTSVSGFIYPDGNFGPLTSQALMQWQTMNGIPASGYFDATSRAKYFEISGYSGGGIFNPPFVDSEENRAAQRIKDTLEMMEDAEDEIEDSNKNTSSAKNSLEDAEEDLMDAVREFFIKKNFSKAFRLADDAFDNAEEAFEDAGGRTKKESAKEAIKDAKDAINDAENDIEEADDDGDDVDEAEDILRDAEDKLDEAEEEFDDKNYDKAEDLAEDAIELADDAVDAID